MVLLKLKEYNPDYRNYTDYQDIDGMDLYVGSERVGTVEDILVDESGKFRYFVINTGVWILGKKVILPIGRARIEYHTGRVYADSLTKEKVEVLPEFPQDTSIDYDHEEQVRGIYRSSGVNLSDVPASYGVGYAGADTAPATVNTAPTLNLEVGYAGYDRSTYRYEKEPDLYNLNDQNHPNLKIYEEKLIASKTH
jgi:hypothetical protein